MTWWAYLFRLIPANFLSFLTGCVTRWTLPAVFQHLLNRWFVGVFKLDLAEAVENDPRNYGCLEDIFTRPLRHGARPIGGKYVSPSDGIVSISLASQDDAAIQVKKITYSLKELVFGKEVSEKPADLSWYSTVYLAPHNYHRVHVPFSGELYNIRYIPGFLWSVNQTFLKAVPQLFTRNERLVFDFKVEGGGKAYVVMVGAFNVGRMTTPFWPRFASNPLLRSRRSIEQPCLHKCKAGDELGTFLLGSTVVVVLDSDAVQVLKPKPVFEPTAIKVGQSLGHEL